MWTARPWVARAIRVGVIVLPLVVSIAIAWLLSGVLPKPHSFVIGVARWFVVALVSTLVLIAVDKLARRLLPLATLFSLTLAFPDQAPSRFRMALRTGSTGQLRRRIEQARSGVQSDTPAEAAERVLELVIALNAHDHLTRGHSERVRAYTQMIGEEMGLTDTELDRLRWSGLLHDIGKLRISASILNKPGKLTAAEWEQIKLHPEYGREFVAPLIGWLGDSARAVWEHHERWDGHGYPYGLSGTHISLAGRIVAVADTYDVMTSMRSYKKAVSPVEARAELTRCAGTQFDPAVVRAFMNLSLGRLRLAMGPLSWLAQLPLFPTALTTTGAAGTTGAATALVGAAAASLGLGLAGDPIVPKDHVAFASVPATSKPFDYGAVDTGPRGHPEAEGAGPSESSPTTEPEAPADSPADTSRTGVARPPIAPGITTTTTPSGTDSTTTTRPPVTTTTLTPSITVPGVTLPAVTLPPGVTTAPTTTRPPVTTTTVKPLITVPGVTLPAVTLPAVTLPPAVTLAPTTTAAPTTTGAPTTTTTTTTVPPRPAWLPPADVPTTLYFDVPGAVDLAAKPLLPLTRTAPTALGVADADGDGRAGITLQRSGNEISFGLVAPTNATIRGGASGVVYVSTAALLASTVSVRARLMVCDSTGACSVASERTSSALVTVLALLPFNYNFGAIDVTVPAGGSLRVVLDVPASSSSDALLSADAVLSASAITVVFR
jgi:hypothetical protein